MEREQVASSDLKSVGYDDTNNILEIEFKNGAIYQYSNVPLQIYTNLMNASSKGKYLHSEIKDKYAFQRII